VKTAVRIKLPENIKKKVRAQFVKNMLFRMLFNDKADEQLEYNLKTVKQLSERPLNKVEDVVYLLESVQPKKQAKKPIGTRIDEFYHDPLQAHAVTLEASENREKVHTVSIEGSGHQGKSLYFSDIEQPMPHQVDVRIEENHLKGRKDKPVPHRNKKDFIFGPFDRPIVNAKFEESWRVNSRSRSKDHSLSNIQDDTDLKQKSSKSPQRILVFRHIDSVGIASNSKAKSIDQYRSLDKAKHSSGVTPFDYNDEEGSSKHSSRNSSLDKSSAVSAKTKPSFTGIQTMKKEVIIGPESMNDIKAQAGKKVMEDTAKIQETPKKDETSSDLFKELGIERSKDKPAPTIDQINIKKEVIQEMDEEEGSEEESAKKKNKPFTLAEEDKSEEDRSLEEPPKIPQPISDELEQVSPFSPEPVVNSEIIPITKNQIDVEIENPIKNLDQVTISHAEIVSSENKINEEKNAENSKEMNEVKATAVEPKQDEESKPREEIPTTEQPTSVVQPDQPTKDDQPTPAATVEDKTVHIPPPSFDDDVDQGDKIEAHPQPEATEAPIPPIENKLEQENPTKEQENKPQEN
jgi:hypothetical protein